MSFFKELKRRNVFRVGIAYTVATWLLIQVSDTVFPRIGLPDSAVTLVIALLAIGFIPALIFAWAFEMTPEGIKLEKDVDRTQSITPQTSKNLNRLIIAGLALVIVIMGVERARFAGHDEPADTQTLAEAPATEQDKIPGTVAAENVTHRESVAVLPFTAMSSGEDDEYFADGLTEEILNSLARLPELLVTARTSSFHFKDKNLPIPEIAATLGVEHVVEGSVRRSGDRVRITAQLIRAEDGFHLWSDTYDRTLENVFAVQEDIAENIASTLDVVLNEDKRQKMRAARIEDVEAFILFQKANEAFGVAHRTTDPGTHLGKANQLYDDALEIVPGITNALYLRADLYGHVIYDHATGQKSYDENALNEALAEIRKSLGQAIQSATSQSQGAIVDAERTMLSDNWTGLGDKLDAAFKPGECSMINWLPSVAVPFGWAQQAADQDRESLRCDPLRALPAIMLVFWEIWNGNAALAVDIAEEYTRKQGFHPWLDDARFLALLASGQYREDPNIFDPNPEGSVLKFPREILVHAKNNDIASAQRVLADWRVDNKVADIYMAMIMAAMGERVQANHYAGLMDARTGGQLALTELIKTCMCGAPFDLDTTPNYKERIQEAGFDWPPLDPMNYPAKDW